MDENFKKYLKIGAFIILTLLAFVFVFWKAILFSVTLDKIISFKQRMLIYEINHKALAGSVRQYFWNNGKINKNFEIKVFEENDSRIPDYLWILNPARIVVRKDRVSFEYGGAFLHYGIDVFPQEQQGEGTLMLENGIWFYSENGRYPKK